MNRFIILYGEPFMIVEPVDALYKSETVRKAKQSGAMFVVNMNTGALTIYRKRPSVDVDKLIEEANFQLQEASVEAKKEGLAQKYDSLFDSFD